MIFESCLNEASIDTERRYCGARFLCLWEHCLENVQFGLFVMNATKFKTSIG